MKVATVKCPCCGASLRAHLIRDGALTRIRLIPEPIPAPPSPAVEVIAPAPRGMATSPPPKAERAPFDEWLLSVRNIKIALYSGALLLVLAGIVFIGSKWGEFGGPVKFGVILLVTGLLYLGGYLLYQRPQVRLGGIAVLSVASGFLPLNFVVLQIFVLGPGGFRADMMWLIASPLCFVLYALTAYWTRASLFTCIGVGALVNMLTAGLWVVRAPALAFPPIHSSLALALVWAAWRLQQTQMASFTRTPLLILTHLAVPLHILAALFGFGLSSDDSWVTLSSPWLALFGIFIGALFYVATDALFGWRAARWAWAGLFPLAFGLTLSHLGFDDTALGTAFMLLAMAYLGIGHGLEWLQGRRHGGWPLYVVAYVLAGWVTFRAVEDTSVLILALLGDVALLAVSGAIFGHHAWIYSAVWLLMLPVYLFLAQTVPTMPNRGLLLGVLGLNYLGTGYALSRHEVPASGLPRRGGPFLTAAAFLSAAVVVLAWGSPATATLLLAVIAILYLGVALWLDRPSLLIPALAAVNVNVFTLQEIFVGYGVVNLRALNIAYTVLTLVLLLFGSWLRRRGHRSWAIPLYIVGTFDLLGSYDVALLDPPLAIALSVIYAMLLLAFAWQERHVIKLPDLGDVPVLTYLGLVPVVVGHFYALDAARLLHNWPPFTAGLCGLFMLVAWGLRHNELAAIYGVPLRWVGLGLASSAMAGALISLHTPIIIATFGIIGLTYSADSAIRRQRSEDCLSSAYLAAAASLVVYWASLRHLDVTEPQAYALPLGLGSLGVGWLERRRGGDLTYRLPTLSGLSLLLGLSFIQSLSPGASVYAIWLAIESIVATWWGVWTHSRGYVSLGTLTLLAHSIFQFGPAFIELPRWIQLAVTGGILLGSGILFLVKREELLRARGAFTKEWKRWEP